MPSIYTLSIYLSIYILSQLFGRKETYALLPGRMMEISYTGLISELSRAPGESRKPWLATMDIIAAMMRK